MFEYCLELTAVICSYKSTYVVGLDMCVCVCVCVCGGGMCINFQDLFHVWAV